MTGDPLAAPQVIPTYHIPGFILEAPRAVVCCLPEAVELLMVCYHLVHSVIPAAPQLCSRFRSPVKVLLFCSFCFLLSQILLIIASFVTRQRERETRYPQPSGVSPKVRRRSVVLVNHRCSMLYSGIVQIRCWSPASLSVSRTGREGCH